MEFLVENLLISDQEETKRPPFCFVLQGVCIIFAYERKKQEYGTFHQETFEYIAG